MQSFPVRRPIDLSARWEGGAGAPPTQRQDYFRIDLEME
jgi:hypothetical protein